MSIPGGYQGSTRGQYAYKDGKFRCGQVNILMALTDIGPGDGGTMIIPGSHKSNLPHPKAGPGQMDRLEGSDRSSSQEGRCALVLRWYRARSFGTDKSRRATRCYLSIRRIVGKYAVRLPIFGRTVESTDSRAPQDIGADPV